MNNKIKRSDLTKLTRIVVKETKRQLKEASIMNLSASLSDDIVTFLNKTIVPKSQGSARNQKQAAELLLNVIKYLYHID